MATPVRRRGSGEATEWTGYHRVLWPTDFSPLANVALPHAVGLAAAAGAELVLLHVLPSLAAYAVPELAGALSVSLQRKARAAAEGQLRRLEQQVKGPNFRVHTVLTEGSRSTRSCEPPSGSGATSSFSRRTGGLGSRTPSWAAWQRMWSAARPARFSPSVRRDSSAACKEAPALVRRTNRVRPRGAGGGMMERNTTPKVFRGTAASYGRPTSRASRGRRSPTPCSWSRAATGNWSSSMSCPRWQPTWLLTSRACMGSDRPGESVDRQAEARPDDAGDQGRAPRAPGPQRLGERRGRRGGPAGGATPPLPPDRARHPRAHRSETRADGQCGRERGAARALSGADCAAAGLQSARITSCPG